MDSQSIDLTKLPGISSSASETAKTTTDAEQAAPVVEYSSREISPPALLIQQLVQAHQLFSLHHGPSLNELFVRLSREKFCSILDRFWSRFARSWDVLLHGNPAADVFNGIKLASGGELGFGVGEEEWGSGEREVLEDLAHRTEGLIDLVVARYGEPASPQDLSTSSTDDDDMPWMGSGNEANAADGVIFGGIGGMQRPSLRTVSQWMRLIYTYGEHAYGVKDNALRESRKRRRYTPGESEPVRDVNGKPSAGKPKNDIQPSTDQRPQASQHSNTTSESVAVDDGRPNIPPPIVTAAERALEDATQRVDQQDVPEADTGTTLGIPDNYMKYLTFGLSTFAKSKPAPPTSPGQAKPPSSVRPAQVRSASSTSPGQAKSTSAKSPRPNKARGEEAPMLTHMDPLPEGDALRAKIATQKRQENRGHFVIGLKGDLLELDELSDDDQTELSDGSFGDDTGGSRIVLRTVQVELSNLVDAAQSTDNFQSQETFKHFRRVRVLIYVHRPFMYCFLFEDRTPSLQLDKFYRSLHRNLVPIYRPLLSSTSASKVAQRIASSDTTPSEGDTTSSPIYDLIYDPRRLTVHTSIPNIPEPGTLAAEGFFSSGQEVTPAFTRVDAINVHSQILNTLVSTQRRRGELERSSKTARGWWVVWMRIRPSGDQKKSSKQSDDGEEEAEADFDRVAFLVRKAFDSPATQKSTSTGSRAVSSMLEVMSLGMTSREQDSTGGASAGWGPAALAGGIGIDARKYVEGLLSLNR